MSMLKSKKHRHRSKNQKCHIDKLPNELLIAVFNAGSESATLHGKLSFPMVVSKVSSLWRQIAINTPSLWTSVMVNFWRIRNSRPNIHLFIERSKMEPLSFNIQFTRPPYTYRSYRELSDAIAKNAHRIHEIIICVESLSRFYDFALPFNALSFPILTRLEFDCIGRNCLSDHTRVFTGAKHIQSMVFPRCPECAPLGPDLTHLEIRHLSSHVLSLRAIFEASPSLHTLTIYKLGRRFVQEPGFRSIVANSLHTLNVTIGYDENDHERKFFSGETCGCPLTYLVTPNLINLAVKLRFGFFCLSKHFRKLPKLEKLKISGLNLDRRDVRWIQKLSTLTHIELVRTDHTGLWDNYKAGSSSDPWRNLTSVTMSSLCGRAEMVKAICRSYTQSPRTITFNIVGRKQEDLEELQSELPNAVFNFIAPETDPFICHDIPHTDYEDIDLWSEGSEDDSSDAETNP